VSQDTPGQGEILHRDLELRLQIAERGCGLPQTVIVNNEKLTPDVFVQTTPDHRPRKVILTVGDEGVKHSNDVVLCCLLVPL